MLVRFNVDSPIVQEVFTGEVIPYGLISNNHAGKRKVIVQETPIRVVCANTLSLALADHSRALKVRHTASVEAKTVEAARQLWSGLIERYENAAWRGLSVGEPIEVILIATDARRGYLDFARA